MCCQRFLGGATLNCFLSSENSSLKPGGEGGGILKHSQDRSNQVCEAEPCQGGGVAVEVLRQGEERQTGTVQRGGGCTVVWTEESS